MRVPTINLLETSPPSKVAWCCVVLLMAATAFTAYRYLMTTRYHHDLKRQLAAQRAHIEHAAKVDAASQKQPFELHWWHTYWLDNKLPWPEALSAIESVAVPEMNLVSVIVAVPEASVKVAAETSDLAVLLDWSYKVAEVSKQQGAACWRWKVLDLALQPSGRYSARLIGVCNQKRTKQLGG